MSEFVAVHPETGVEYPVHSKAELVNLIARGYRDGSTSKRKTGSKSTAAKTPAAAPASAPESQK